MDEHSLAGQFTFAKRQWDLLKDRRIDPEDPAEKDALSAALRACITCIKLIRDENIFSTNEKLEDLHTEHIPLLLVEYYIAKLTEKLPDERAKLAPRAAAALEAFLQACERYQLLSEADTRYWHIGGKTDPTTKRSLKIARFREEKEMRSQIQVSVFSQLRLSHSWKAPQELEKRIEESAAVDEEAQRELYLSIARFTAAKAIEDLQSLQQEQEMLAAVAAQRATAGPDSGPISEEEDRRTRAFERAEAKRMATDPSRPGIEIQRIDPSLNVTRETVKASVFQFGHRLPTMSLEELADRELADAQERQARQTAAALEQPRTQEEISALGLEDDEEAVDGGRERTRAFEDWRDNVTKGWGNTKRI